MPSSSTEPRHLVVMGVSGTGKTTIADLLADRLGYPFAEGDDFHSPANRSKMASGTALEDADRASWLAAIRDWMSEQGQAGTSTVVACSALRHRYREVLRQAVGAVIMVHLDPPADVVRDRMVRRRGHYMPVSLLESQLATLEPLELDEAGLVVHNTGSPPSVVAEILQMLPR